MRVCIRIGGLEVSFVGFVLGFTCLFVNKIASFIRAPEGACGDMVSGCRGQGLS